MLRPVRSRGRAAGGPGGQQVGGQQGSGAISASAQHRHRRLIGQRGQVGCGPPQGPAQNHVPSGIPKASPMTASRVACVSQYQPGLPPGQPQRPQYGQFVPRRRTAMDSACPTAPMASRAKKAPSASGSTATSLSASDLARSGLGVEGEGAGRPGWPRPRRCQPVRDRLDIRARPQGHHPRWNLNGVVRTAEQAVIPARGEPRAVGVVVVRPGRHEGDAGHPERRCGVVPPASRTAVPVTACRSLAVAGASTISSGAPGIRPPVSTTGICLPPTGS